MLYLHCGWPRTSTTSLQTALYERRDRLYADGLFYPDEWRSRTGITHHGLGEMLQASLDSAGALDDFERLLAAHADRDVLFSAEVLSTWVVSERKQDALLGLLATAQRAMPVRCLWTLRRHDELLISLALVNLKMGSEIPPALRQPLAPSLKARGAGNVDGKFAGMRRVERALDGDVVYLEYDPAGGHNLQFLRALGLAPAMTAEVAEALQSGPRRHPSPTVKEVVALLNVEALSARAGVAFDRARLQRLFTGPDFSHGDFRFEDDRRFDPADAELRSELHERALAAARRHGVTSYVEFFEGAEIEAHATADLGLENITDRDLERLVAHMRERDHAAVT